MQAVRVSQERRQAIMAETCEKYFPASNKTTGRYPLPLMWSSDKQQFLYCVVPKVRRHLLFFSHFQIYYRLIKQSVGHSRKGYLSNYSLWPSIILLWLRGCREIKFNKVSHFLRCERYCLCLAYGGVVRCIFSSAISSSYVFRANFPVIKVSLSVIFQSPFFSDQLEYSLHGGRKE